MNDKIRITVLHQEQYDGGPFPFSYDAKLDAVIKCLKYIRSGIPSAYRDSATCEIDSVGGYEGSHYASMTISYLRPMTNTEKNQRDDYQKREAAEQLERARSYYEQALKAAEQAAKDKA